MGRAMDVHNGCLYQYCNRAGLPGNYTQGEVKNEQMPVRLFAYCVCQ